MRKLLWFLFSFMLFGLFVQINSVYALEITEISGYGTGAYINKSCDCYAHALDVSRGDVAVDNDIAKKCVAPGSSVSSEAWVQDTFQNQAFALANSLAGICESTNDALASTLQQKSALGMTTGAMISLYTNPPASNAYYVAYLLENAGVIEPAYAQGIGYSGLYPIINLWRLFRNMSYIIIVGVLIVIGFMIMFRMNINPQTVISIQNSLPNIIITLILITFSYAIAGLLIDLMYFVTLLLTSLFGLAVGTADNTAELQQAFLNSNLGTLFKYFLNKENIVDLPSQILKPVVITLGGAGGALGAIFAGPGSGVTIGALLGAIPILLVVVGLFFAFLRLLMILITSYIYILLYVIFAPLILLQGAVPGSSAFVNWLRTLVGNLSVYPTTMGIFLLVKAISVSIEGKDLWGPPFLFGPINDSEIFINALIGLGILLMAPTLILRVKGMIAPKPGVPIGAGVFLGPTAGMVSKGVGLATLYHQLGGAKFVENITKGKKTPSGETPSPPPLGN